MLKSRDITSGKWREDKVDDITDKEDDVNEFTTPIQFLLPIEKFASVNDFDNDMVLV